jgi:hypothetical protein
MIKEGVGRSAENANPPRMDPGSRSLALTWPGRLVENGSAGRRR